MSTLPAQFVSGGQSVFVVGNFFAAAVSAVVALFGTIFCGAGGRFASGTSKNTSKKLFGAIGGTSKCPIGPKFGWNTPNSCELMSPLAGSVGLLALSFVQCWWKRIVPFCGTQSTELSFGGFTPQSHAVEQMSIVLVWVPQVNVMLGQQLVPEGTGPAVSLMKPDHPTGTGFGAGVRSSLTSDMPKPGHRPETVHGIGEVQLLGRKWM